MHGEATPEDRRLEKNREADQQEPLRLGDKQGARSMIGPADALEVTTPAHVVLSPRPTTVPALRSARLA